MLVVARCTRCGFPLPITEDELTGDGGGDPSLLVVIVPPDGCIGNPDSDGVIHGYWAYPEEIEEWMAGLAVLEP